MADDRYVLEIVVEDQQAAAALQGLDRAQDALGGSGARATTVVGGLESAMGKASMVGSAVGATLGNLAAGALTNLIGNVGQSITAVVDFSGELVDLSNKTGLSITALQELKFAGDQTGVGLDTITKSVVMLGRNLAGGKEGAADAARVLGLSFTDLRAMSPEQAFYTVAEAVRGVHDPMAQAKIMTELFGKAGVELLPLINDQSTSLGALKQSAHDLGVVISEDTIRSAEGLGDQWGVMKTQGMALMAELIRPFIPLAVALANTLIDFAQAAMPYVRAGLDGLYAAFLAAKLGIADFLASLLESVAKVPILGEKLGIVGEGASYFRTMASGAQKALDDLALSHVVASPKVQRLTVDMGDLDKSASKAAASATKEAEAIDKIAGQGALDAAENMAKAIEKHGLAAVVAANGLDKVHETFDKALTLAETRGEVAPKIWLDTAVATMEADKNLNTYVEGIPKVGQQMATLDPGKFFKDLAAATNAELPKVLDGLPPFLAEAAAQLGTGATTIVAPTFAQSFKAGALGAKGLAGLGQDIGNVVVQAFAGGGNVGDAVGSVAGKAIGSGLNSAFQGMFAKGGMMSDIANTGLGKMLSGAAGAVLPGVGALLGAGMSALMDTVFKGEEKKVNDMRDSFVASAGGLTALNEEAAKAGVTLDKLLDAKKTKDFEAAQKELTKAIEAHKAALAELDKGLTETFTKGITLTDQLATDMLKLFQQDPEGAGKSIFKFLQGEIGNVTSGFNTAATAWSETLTGGEQGFQRFGIAAVAAFEAAKEAGASVPEALAAIKPGLEALIKGMGDLGGGTGGNAAFDQLLSIATMSEQFQPLLDQVSGLTGMITSLGNVGLLTQDTFAALSDQVGETFSAMTAQGAGAEDAMRLIQPQLQKLWEAENQFGVSTQGATGDLLNQAFQAGIVGTQFSSAQDKMIDAVNRLVTRMGDMITVMTGGTVSSLVGGAQWASTQVSGALAGAVPGTAWDAGVGALSGKVRSLGEDATVAAGDVGRNLGNINTTPAWDRINVVGGYVDDWLPWKAGEGARDIGNALGDVNTGPLWDKVQSAGNYFDDWLPWKADLGINDVNAALNRIDVGGVQDAVHDIDWEFEQGIPDAAESGVELVNTSMDSAEGSLNDVREQSAKVSNVIRFEIPYSAGVAGGAIYDFAQDAVDYLGDIEDAATGAAWGQSPTGIKEIPIALAEARAAMQTFERESLASLRAVERAAPQVTFDVGGTTDPVAPLRGLVEARVTSDRREEQDALAARLADAVVVGFARSGIKVDVEGRTFGRLVAEHGPRGIRRSSATRR